MGNSTILIQDGKMKIVSYVACFYSKCSVEIDVRRIVHSKLKLFHFQIKKYYLSDANHQTDNPSHTNNPSLV